MIRWLPGCVGEAGDAVPGSADGRAVQLGEPRKPGAGEAQAADDPALGRRDTGGAAGGVPAAQCGERAAVDSAGEAVAGAAAAGLPFGARRHRPALPHRACDDGEPQR